MKSRTGKIVIGLLAAIVITAAVLVAWPREAQASHPAKTFTIPDDDYDNLCVTFYDQGTGDMYDATTGAVTLVFADAAVVCTKHTTNTGVWVLTAPPLPIGKRIGIGMYDTASPADTDKLLFATKYHPDTTLTYTDSGPAVDGKTVTTSGGGRY